VSNKQIVAHRLVAAPFFESPNCGNGPLKPELLVLHYTVSWPATAVVRAFKSPATRASAHLVLDLDGTWTQMVAFNRQAWHAGESSWEGRAKLNTWSIGIEIVNPGPVFPRVSSSGEVVQDVNERVWTGGYKLADPGRLPPKCPPGWKHWATYTVEQVAALESVCRLLVQEYGLRAIIGHSDIAPGRKFDPGPMLPIERIREHAFAKSDTEPSPPPVMTTSPPLDPEQLPVLQAGPRADATSPYVEFLQTRLNETGTIPPLLVDGHFWTKTDEAVRLFQRSRFLKVDGVVGGRTWRELLREVSP
jgi:N-acetylmuramoyl-L-alanine amidase